MSFVATIDVDVLAAMRAAGVSYGNAAKELGVSRNVLLGYAYRRRIQGDSHIGPIVIPPREPKPKEPKPPRKNRSRYAAEPRELAGLSDLPLFSAVARYKALAPETLGRTVVSIGRLECRYVGDDGKWCGHATGQASWCPYHQALVYAPRRKAA